jgi:hypothetical protein
MTTTTLLPVPNEVKFLKDLEGILPKDFNARVYPDDEGRVSKARININADLDGALVKKLTILSAKWNLPLMIGRSGAGLKIHFGKE